MKDIFIRFGVLLLMLPLVFSCQQKPDEEKSQKKEKTDSAGIEQLTAEIRKDPENAENFSKRALLYFEQEKIEEAIHDAEIALKIDSLQPDYYMQLA